MYFTKKLASVFNMPDEVLFKVTDDKSIKYLDIDAIFEHVYSFRQNLQQSPNSFLGVCSVRQMLSSDDIEFGRLENGKFVMKIDKEICEIDFSSLQEALLTQGASNSENPMRNILKSLGIIYFQESLTERLKEMFSKAQPPNGAPEASRDQLK